MRGKKRKMSWSCEEGGKMKASSSFLRERKKNL